MHRRSRFADKRKQRREKKLDPTVAADLITLVEKRVLKPGSHILSLHLARLAYLAGEDFTKFPESILSDRDGAVMLDTFRVRVWRMITKIKKRLENNGIVEYWAADFDRLLNNQEALEAGEIVILAEKKRRKKRSKSRK